MALTDRLDENIPTSQPNIPQGADTQAPEPQEQEVVQESPVTTDAQGNLSTGFSPLKEEVQETVTEEAPQVQAPADAPTGLVGDVEGVREEAPVLQTPEVPQVDTKVEAPADTKVQDAQVTKSNQLANQEQEAKMQAEKNQKTITEFNNALQSGASMEELAKIANTNPEARTDLDALVRNHFKNKSNVEFFKKYSNFTVEQLDSAVKNGDIVVGSEQYNTLPETQRAAFEQYSKENNANATTQDIQNQFSVDNNKTISLQNIVQELQTVFSSNLREKSQQVLNSPQINAKAQELEDKQNEINKTRDIIDGIEDEVRSEFPGATEGQIRAIISDRTRKEQRNLNTQINEYNSALGTYKSLKENAESDIALLRYEDEQNRQLYSTALNLYESRRSEMQAAEIAEFEAKNRQLAEDIQFQRQLQLKEFEANLKKEQQGGIYETDRHGRQVYIKDGVATFVRNIEGEVLFTEDRTKEGYKDTTTKENGVIVTTRTYTDGRAPEYFTYDVNGNSATNGNNTVNNLVSNIKGDWQCGAAVNRYVTQQLGISKDDFWMGNSYESKSKYINDTVPEVGGVAIWNDTNYADGKFAEFGHTGIVTGYNLEKGTVQITDWNWNGDEKKNVHDVAISDILGSDGGFFNPETIPKASGYDTSKTPLYTKYWSDKGLTSSEWKTIDQTVGRELFTAQAELYQNEKTRQGTRQIERLFDVIQRVRDTDPGRVGRITSLQPGATFVSKDLADYKAAVDALVNNLAFDELVNLKKSGATFGSLTETEFQNIGKSATSLNQVLSDEAFLTELDRIENQLKLGLSEERIAELEGRGQEQTEITTQVTENTGVGSLYQVTKQRIDTSDFNSIIGK